MYLTCLLYFAFLYTSLLTHSTLYAGETERCIHAQLESTTQNSGEWIRHSAHSSTREGQSVQPPYDASPRQNKPRDAILVIDDDKKRFPTRNANTSNDAIVDQSTENSAEREDKIETNQQVAPQQCVSGGRESSSLWIVFSCARNRESVQVFLRNNLGAFISDIEETKYDHTQMIKSAVIQFSNNARAINALHILKCKEEFSSVALVIELCKRIRADNGKCLAKHENKIECLKGKLSRLATKKGYIDIDKHQQISEERKALNLKISECEQQRYELEIM